MATTISNIASLSRKLARTNSNDLPDADVIDYVNSTIQEVHKILVVEGLQADSLKEATVTLTVGVGTFSTAADCWIFKAAEINWQDPNNQNLWLAMDKVDVANLPPGITVDWLRLNNPTADPLIDWRGNVAEVFPTPTSALPVNPVNALKYWYWSQPSDYVAITDTVAYPESMDFRMIAYKVAAIFLETLASTSSIALAKVREQQFQDRLETFKLIFQQGGQTSAKAKDIGITGYEF